MPILHAIVLGIVQGLSEFLPISSTGHLAIAQWALGWDDFGDNETLSKSFDVAVHFGTLAGVVAYFWRDIGKLIARGVGDVVQRRKPFSPEGRTAWLLVLSTLPAAVVGALFNDAIVKLDDEIWLIAVTLILFSFVLLWADRQSGTREGDDWQVKDTLVMGTGQAISLLPGVSRSGLTISAGLWRHFRRTDAARLAFLMSVPVIAGAGAYEFVQLAGEGGVPTDFRAAFAWGAISSAITGWFAVWLTLRIVRTHTFLPFVIYRISLGVVILIALAAGFRS
jgi:undecaprenyl-diphosphatase